MSGSATAVELAFVARLEKFRKEVEKMPQIGQKEAGKLVVLMEQEYKKNEQNAKKSAAKAAKEAEKAAAAAQKATVDGWKGSAKALAGFGGTIGSTTSMLVNWTEGLAQAAAGVGPLGVAVGATTLGVAALGFGLVASVHLLKGVADASVAARDRLREAGELYGVDPEDLDSIRNYEHATRQLSVTVDELTVAVGSGLAGELGVLSAALNDTIQAARDTESPLDEASTATALWATNLAVLGPIGSQAVTQLGRLYGAATETTRASLDAAAAAEEEIAQRVALGVVIEDEVWDREAAARAARELAEAERKAAAAVREYQTARREGASEISDHYRTEQQQQQRRAAANEALADLIREATSDQLTDEGKLQQALEDRLALLGEIRVAASDPSMQARAELEARLQRDLVKLDQERVKKWFEGQDAMLDKAESSMGELLRVIDTMSQEMQQRAQERIEQQFADLDSIGSMAGTTAALFETLHGNKLADITAEQDARNAQFQAEMRGERDALDRKLESGQISEEQHAQMLRDLKEEQREKRKAHRAERKEAHKQATKAFNSQKNAQRGQAIIDASRAALALIPGYAYLGPGATLAAGLSAGAALATSLITINRQKPPEFPGGGSVADRVSGDHHVIAARLDEGIVSPRGMALIGDQGLDAINGGQGGGRGPTILQLDRRTIAEAYESATGVVQLRPVAGRVSGRAPVYGRG